MQRPVLALLVKKVVHYTLPLRLSNAVHNLLLQKHSVLESAFGDLLIWMVEHASIRYLIIRQ